MKNLLLLIAALWLSACANLGPLASLNPVAKPEVAITHLQLGENRGFQQQLNVGLQLDNPNGFDINLGKMRYQISLGGTPLAGGSLNESLSLPANDRLNLVVPVELNLLNGLGLVSSLVNSPQDQLEYELSLTVDVLNFGLGDITISKNGMVGFGGAGADTAK